MQKKRTARSPRGKARTGIDGFDELTGGGIPHDRITLVAGRPGSGKTVFALQTLTHGAAVDGEPGIFVAFEENADQLLANAASFEWPLDEVVGRSLHVEDAHLPRAVIQGGDFDLVGFLEMLRARIRKTGARRIVFDGLDVLLSHLPNPAAERREVQFLFEWIRENRLTAIITSKIDGPEPFAHHYGYMPFLADVIVLLDLRTTGRLAYRALRILKYRGSPNSADEVPFLIGPKGLDLALLPAARLDHAVSTERISSGVAGLDAMLQGGYYRGSSILISGAPGTAKTTLSGSMAAAAAARGEKTLYISFDEAPEQIIRNLASVGIGLRPHVRKGTLLMHSADSRSIAAEHLVGWIQDLLRRSGARNLVIDPLSALVRKEGEFTADATVELLLHARQQGVTVVSTSLLTAGALDEETTTGISTIADTWMHVSYVVQGGERNRALTIVKSRGMRHSNQVRELVLSDGGIELAEVYSAGGEVLMGTVRWEKEAQNRAAAAQRQREIERRRLELETQLREGKSRLELLHQSLEKVQQELKHLSLDARADVIARREHEAMLRTRRMDVIVGKKRGRS